MEIVLVVEVGGFDVVGVSKFGGVSVFWCLVGMVMVISYGFNGVYLVFCFGLFMIVIVGEGIVMEWDYDFDSWVFFEDLDNFGDIGCRVGECVVCCFNL